MNAPRLETYVHLIELSTASNHPIDALGTIIDYIYRTHDKSISSRKLVKAFIALQNLHHFYGVMPIPLLAIKEDLLEYCMYLLNADEKASFLGAM